MKKVKSIFLLLLLAAVCAAGLWVYRSWQEKQNTEQNQELINVYIVKGKGNVLTVYSQDGQHEYIVKDDLIETEYTGLGDVCVRNDEVKKLVYKPDQITAKVLAIGEAMVELENYGQIPLDPKNSCYTVGAGIVPSSMENLYVGQTDARFVVAGGKLCGVLFPEETKQDKAAETGGNIRVILKTDGFASYEHAEVRLRGTKKLYVKRKKTETEVQAGEEIVFNADSMKESRVSVRSEDGGRVELSSVSRNGEKPLYRGTMEVVKTDQGLHVINELPLEEYLYGVIPSEMPAEYGKEALKAQAVCARSYAAKHMKNNRLKEMGAHVDDSVSYQVYNNTKEDERCKQAVDETKGIMAYYGGKIASTYFFSTACGVTSSARDVGFSDENIPYLSGRLQEPEWKDQDSAERAKLVSEAFGDEDLFRKFLDEDRTVLEKSQPWYRWSTAISLEDMENNINAKIGSRCQAAGESIQVRQADGTYVSEQIDSIGKLKRIRIKERGDGGVVTMAVIVGTEKTVRVFHEYNIRLLFFNENAIIRKNDGTNVSGMSMLPSGFFVCDLAGRTYEFRGGGFGHGTGMSQTGANELAQAGKTYEEILQYYFEGVEVRK